MSKKYSIQMKDDQVVYVEVDGTHYASPDLIPDETDRDRILDLVSKSYDKNFDEEFEADFRELERQSAGAPKIIISVFLAVGVLMLLIAMASTVSTIRAISQEESAPGQVVDMTVRASADNETGILQEYYYPVVEFNLPDGTFKRLQLSEGSWPLEYEIGQSVTILYNPEHPLDARIKSLSSTMLKWIFPAITGIVGVVFLSLTLIVRRFLNSDSPE